MKKIIISSLIAMLCLAGCSQDKYVRDTSAGAIEAISVAQFKAMSKTDKTFIAIVTQTGCGHCETIKTMLNKYLKKHHVIVYEINVKNEKNPQVAFDWFEEHYEDFYGTPATVVYDGGEFAKLKSGELSSDDFDDIVVEYHLDNKE